MPRPPRGSSLGVNCHATSITWRGRTGSSVQLDGVLVELLVEVLEELFAEVLEELFVGELFVEELSVEAPEVDPDQPPKE